MKRILKKIFTLTICAALAVSLSAAPAKKVVNSNGVFNNSSTISGGKRPQGGTIIQQ